MLRRIAVHLGIRSPQAPFFAASARSADPVDQIDYAADHGFAGVSDNCLLARPPLEQTRIGQALARRGLTMGSFTLAQLAAPFPWGAPEAPVAEAIDAAVAAAERAGGGLITVMLADSGAPRAAQLATARDNLRIAADRAAAGDCVLALEATSASRVPGALVELAAEAGALVEAIDHPALKLLVDTCHTSLGGEDAAGIVRRHAARLGAVQIADMPGRVEPGAGELDFAPLLQALDDIGYPGMIEAEFFVSQPGRAGEQAALAALRGLGV